MCTVLCDACFICFSEPEKMKSMSQLAVMSRRWSPATMKLGPFQEVILESSSVEELKEKVTCILTWHVMYCFTIWKHCSLTHLLTIIHLFDCYSVIFRMTQFFFLLILVCSSVKSAIFLWKTWILQRYVNSIPTQTGACGAPELNLNPELSLICFCLLCAGQRNLSLWHFCVGDPSRLGLEP